MCFSRSLFLPLLAIVLCAASFSFPTLAHSNPISAKQIPPQLAPWQEWVLFGQEQRLCTPIWQQESRSAQPTEQPRQCLWSGELSLNLNDAGGTFEQYWELDRDGWILVPGNEKYWPQQVKLDGEAALVMRADQQQQKQLPVGVSKDRPLVYAQAGTHVISGSFSWQQLPQNLAVAPQSALIKLTCSGTFIHQPQLENSGILWLQSENTNAQKSSQDSLSIQVYRLVTDSIPLNLITNIQLEISGKEREINTGIILPPGFVPLELNSPLPARLEGDGSLKLQVKPGRWTIELTTRHLGPVDTLTMSNTPPPWPQQEIWSIQTQNELRLISIEGGSAIDPTQTSMPSRWKRLPAYMLTGNQELQFTTRKRGNSDPVAEQIQLQRTLWLDFDGQGYTAKDSITGQLSSRARLEAGEQLAVGRVIIDGKDQFITQLAPDTPAGVEIRHSRINLQAESRIVTQDNGKIAAVGWNINPTSLKAQLNLPPGWRLLKASGPDSASSTWLRDWSLLDIFIVLVLSLSFARLWGPLSGIAALLGLALIYHEPQAPQLVWLNVLIPVALLRVLPDGRFKQLTQWYRMGGLLLLLVICLSFSVQQIRSAIYPQLEAHITNYRPQASRAALNEATDAVAMKQMVSSSMVRVPVAQSANLGQDVGKIISQYDPDLKITTGPGLPQWNWRSIQLSWNGPVNADQTLQLYLLPPWATRLLLLTGVALLALMYLRLFSPAPLPRWKRGNTTSSETLVLILSFATLLTLATPPSASANDMFPAPELLEQLQHRLLLPDSCAPNCISLNELDISADQKLLRLRLTYHCQAERAVPLPLPLQQLHLQSARLDKSSQVALYRQDDDQLWAKIPQGIHTLELYANLPAELQRFQLPLIMPAGMVHINAAGWTITGAHDGQTSQGAIDLTRNSTVTTKQLQPNEVPPFATVQREIYLGLDWHVRTTVRRVSQSSSAALLQIPLLPNEHVTSRGVNVTGHQVLVNFAPGTTSFSWDSSLGKNSELELLAAQTDQFSEIWSLTAEPIWHINSAGIPVIHYYNNDNWQPQWRPWPGEQLTLNISRPNGIQGQMVTIDNSQLTLTSGSRTSEATLKLQLRSSHGTEHTITLPDQAQLTEVLINSRPQPIKQQQRLVKIPLVPGAQTIELRWQQPQGIDLITHSPQVHLEANSVDSTITLNIPKSRWTLFAYGPLMGPAVLFWGVMLVIVILAVILGRYTTTPLRWWHWLLLFVGLSQASLPALIPVAAWLILLGLRPQWAQQQRSALGFNMLQLTLIVLSIVALTTILAAIQQGLLGLPEMQIAGNHSSPWRLNWYQDRCSGFLPEAWVVSVPMYIYRLFMLLWALWLALALMKWLHWGWSCFSTHGVWRKLPPRQKHQKQSDKNSVPPSIKE
ncbi:MAG: hypothetical protein RBR22_02235 [Desulfuromonas sp.]|nr:hypothetical protein [Desulfuromonas sp.]